MQVGYRVRIKECWRAMRATMTGAFPAMDTVYTVTGVRTYSRRYAPIIIDLEEYESIGAEWFEVIKETKKYLIGNPITCPSGHKRSFTMRGLSIYDCHDCEGNGYSGRFYLRGGKAFYSEPVLGLKKIQIQQRRKV